MNIYKYVVLCGLFILVVSKSFAGNIDCSQAQAMSANFSTFKTKNSGGGADLILNACAGDQVEVPTNPNGVYVLPLQDIKDLIKLYMCGAQPSVNANGGAASMGFDTQGNWKDEIELVFDKSNNNAFSSNVNKSKQSPVALDNEAIFKEATKLGTYCSDIWAKTGSSNNVAMITCHFDDLDGCSTPIKESFSYSDIVKGQGLAVRVTVALVNAAYKVRSGIPLDPATSANDKLALQVLNGTNLPIYQMLNVAALEPAIGTELLANMSIIYSRLLVHQYFEDLMYRMRQNMPAKGIPAQLTQRLDIAMNTMKEGMAELMQKSNDDVIKQTELMKRIADITKSIRQETLTADMQDNLKYTNTLLNKNF